MQMQGKQACGIKRKEKEMQSADASYSTYRKQGISLQGDHSDQNNSMCSAG